jgi:hypothetical protein
MKKIIFILGAPRSGTTLLSNILNQIENVISVGELHYIWNRGIINNWVCGNNKSFSDEKFWIDILSDFSTKTAINSQEYSKLDIESINTIRKWSYIYSFSTIEKKIISNFSDYIKVLEQLYDSIFKVSDAEIIVDSSKLFEVALLISMIKKYQIYYLHIIRDPRAVTYSRVFNKKKQITSIDNIIQMGKGITINKSIRNWLEMNYFSEKFFKRNQKKYKRIYYEKFSKQPNFYLDQILKFCNIHAENPIKNNIVEIQKPNFAFSGNPVRLIEDKIIISNNMVWKKRMKFWNKIYITLITIFYLKKYKIKSWRTN